MARPKKIIEQQLDVTETGLIYEQPEEILHIPTIHEKYQKYIDMAKDGYISGFTYPMTMEVLRYCENKRGCQFGLNMSCGNCIIDLLKMFDNLR